MPLYEMVMICKIGETQGLSLLMKDLVRSVYLEGGVIRQFKNLGDRISQKRYKAKDGTNFDVIRYITCEFDANPETMKSAHDIAKSNSETLTVYVHKLKEGEYYKNIYKKEAFNQMEVAAVDPKVFEEVMVKKTAQDIYSSKIKQEFDFNKVFGESNSDSCNNYSNGDKKAQKFREFKNKI